MKFIFLANIILGLSLFGQILFAQTTQLNAEKYLIYKKKLENYFLIKSDPLSFPHYGTYIPAHKRNPFPGFPNSGQIHWTDAGHTIGFYLATLAAEYAIHEHKNNDVGKENCLKDIVNVLKTIERLDYLAEIRYESGSESLKKVGDSIIIPYPYPKGSLNGFFIRDDVTRIEIFENSIANFWSKKGIKTFEQTPFVSSDYWNHGEMSQDQVWNYLQGLALTQKLVKTDQKFMDGEGEYVTPDYWAQKIVARIAKTMHSEVILNVAGLKIPIKMWAIVNPATKKIVKRGGKPIDLVFNARLFGHAMNQITEMKFGDLRYGFRPKLKLKLPLPGYKHFNDHAKFALATIGNRQHAQTWDELLYWSKRCAKKYNKGMDKSYQKYTYIHFPLMYILLHSPEIDASSAEFSDFISYVRLRLDQAPKEGQWRSLYDLNEDGKKDKNDHPEPFWSAGKRLVKPAGKDYIINKNDPATQPWEYNGLDYMLLYNLHELVRTRYYSK